MKKFGVVATGIKTAANVIGGYKAAKNQKEQIRMEGMQAINQIRLEGERVRREQYAAAVTLAAGITCIAGSCMRMSWKIHGEKK